MRYFTILICTLAIGCQPASMVNTESQPVTTLALPRDTGLPEPSEFSNWPSVAKELYQVGSDRWVTCIGPTPAQQQADKKRYGLHLNHGIRIRVNKTGIENFNRGKPMPVGSVVVKEKYDGSPSTLVAYALMIKREDGYDSGNGNWQYVYVDAYAKPPVVEGKLANCILCHRGAKDTDYLFKFYLSDSTKKE